ncbi:MAG: hypothetical protein M3Y05_16235 [Gemmatimonadota bacterium]|nr:hypothetical protein [Gemmatimonadota bacterium]
MLVVPVSKVYGQEECQCTAPGGESSRIASAIGGGLFAGLIAAVIPFHHAGALAAAPNGAVAPSALTTMSDSTDIAPGDSAKPQQLTSLAAVPNGGAAPNDAGASPVGGRAAPISRTSNGESAAALPAITPSDAAADGMIAPKTATMLPSLAMIGVGAMLMGIFFLRVRRPRLRSR